MIKYLKATWIWLLTVGGATNIFIVASLMNMFGRAILIMIAHSVMDDEKIIDALLTNMLGGAKVIMIADSGMGD